MLEALHIHPTVTKFTLLTYPNQGIAMHACQTLDSSLVWRLALSCLAFWPLIGCGGVSPQVT